MLEIVNAQGVKFKSFISFCGSREYFWSEAALTTNIKYKSVYISIYIHSIRVKICSILILKRDVLCPGRSVFLECVIEESGMTLYTLSLYCLVQKGYCDKDLEWGNAQYRI